MRGLRPLRWLGALLLLGALSGEARPAGPSAPPPSLRTLAAAAAPASLTGTTAETVLASIVVPGGAMGPSGQLRVTLQGSFSATASSKTLRVRLGGLAGALHFTRANSSSTVLFERAQVQIANRGAEASQIGSAPAVTAFNTATSAPYTSTVDTSTDQVLVITGQLAATTDTLTLDSYSVELLRP